MCDNYFSDRWQSTLPQHWHLCFHMLHFFFFLCDKNQLFGTEAQIFLTVFYFFEKTVNYFRESLLCFPIIKKGCFSLGFAICGNQKVSFFLGFALYDNPKVCFTLAFTIYGNQTVLFYLEFAICINQKIWLSSSFAIYGNQEI